MAIIKKRNYDEELEILKSTRNYYEERMNLITKDHNQREVGYIQGYIDETNKKIRRLLLEKEIFGLVLPYFESIGIKFDMESQDISYAFKLAKYEDKKYIEYYMQNFHESEDEDELNEICGKLIFDDKGELLLDLDTSNNFYLNFQDLDDFVEISPDNIFVTKDDVIINLGSIWIPKYAHYKFNGKKYVEKHEFTSADSTSKKVDDNEYATYKKLQLGDGELGVCYGRLYSVSKGDFVNDLEFDNIIDYTYPVIKTPYMGVLLDEAWIGIKRTLEENNLLIGTTTIRLDKEDKITTAVYLDKEGNIVSKLFYYPYFFRYDKKKRMESDLLCMDTSNETYITDLGKVEEESKNYIKSAIDSELFMEERERKLNQMRRERMLRIMTTVDLTKSDCGPESKKYTMKPKENPKKEA